MTRDYAKPSTTRKTKGTKTTRSTRTTRASIERPTVPEPRRSRKANAFSILLIFAVIGASLYGLYKLAQIPGQPANQVDAVDARAIKKSKQQERAQDKPTARFQFYDLLPKSEVETDTVDAYTFKEKGASEEYSYMLQTGSFKSAKDAERQKATIAFQGLKAAVKTVSSDSGSKWHRVQTGPYYSRSEMNAALDKLVAINIQPLVKKNKK